MKKKLTFDELLTQALENALEDRGRAVAAFENTKGIYDVNIGKGEESDSSDLQGLMLIGQNVSKLLEISVKANEQIIKLAQLKEKEESRTPPETKERSGPIDIEQLKEEFGDEVH